VQATQATPRRHPVPAHGIASVLTEGGKGLLALLGALELGLAAVWGKVASWRKATPA
jgi:hypothetical protein